MSSIILRNFEEILLRTGGGCGKVEPKGESGVKITLWTIQHADAWAALQRDGVLRGDPERVWAEFQPAYDWMAARMEKRIGPPPEGVRVPLWAWYQWEGRRGARDLRQSGYARRGTPMVQIEFEIGESLALLSDFDRWHTVLCGGYLALDAQDPGTCPVEASWERIFDLDHWTPGWDTPPEEQSIQAVFWELRLEQVRKVRHFIAK